MTAGQGKMRPEKNARLKKNSDRAEKTKNHKKVISIFSGCQGGN
jgi:hypothetical protein